MNLFRNIAAWCAAILLGVAAPLHAQKVYTVDDVPNVHSRDVSSYVSNPDGTLSPQTVAQINSQLLDLQQQTSIEVAVVAVESIGDVPPEDFGIELFRKWGIGKQGKDNGLLILLVTGDRIIRFEVGYGLEGVMTDAISKRIQTTRMMPYLREGDWNGAMLAAVEGVKEYLTDPDSDLGNVPDDMAQGYRSPLGGMLFVLGGLIVIMLAAWFSARRRNKCPRCGHQMRVVDTKSAQISRNTRVTTTTLKCPKCGYTTSRNTTQNMGGGGFMGGMGGGMIGGMGRGFGGGGFGGGFGGGSAGGGGATSRF